jgi:hypothetical protein
MCSGSKLQEKGKAVNTWKYAKCRHKKPKLAAKDVDIEVDPLLCRSLVLPSLAACSGILPCISTQKPLANFKIY